MVRLGLAASWLMAALVFGTSQPARADGAGGSGVGAGPAPGAPGVLAGGGYFAPTLSPGSTWTSELVVANDSATTTPIAVYGTDGLTADVSGAVYSNLGTRLVGAGNWVTPSVRTINVSPFGQATVRFSVKVPPTATPGDHLAGIAAQSAAPSTPASGHLRVEVVARAVVAILIRVPGPASFSATVGEPTVASGPLGVGEVVTPLTDTGRLIGKPTVNVTLSGSGGYENSVTKQVDTLLPGGSAHFPVYWPDHLLGTYHVTSCLTWAGHSAPICRSATVTVDVPTKTVKDLHTKRTGGSGVHLPSWVLILLSACAGAALMGLILRLRRPSSRGARRAKAASRGRHARSRPDSTDPHERAESLADLGSK